jgi:hypothetical protein
MCVDTDVLGGVHLKIKPQVRNRMLRSGGFVVGTYLEWLVVGVTRF